jgi:hypothetical protein
VHFDPADVCDQIELEGAISVTTHGFSGILHDAVISHEDLLWAVDFIHRLNVKISNGAIVFGWNFVTGVADAFASHGYCNMDTWTVHYGQSWVNQDDQNGTLHPNNMGHNGYATQILQAMLAHGVGSANVTSFIPPGPVRWVPPI